MEGSWGKIPINHQNYQYSIQLKSNHGSNRITIQIARFPEFAETKSTHRPLNLTRIVAEAVSTTPLFSTAFTMDPSLLCKAFFCFGIAVDIGGTLFPSFREHIMTYGSRGTDSQASTEDKKQSRTLFDYVASIQVPHTWFTHYYVVSVSSSIFWAFQIYSHGRIFEFLASYSQPNHSMTVNQVFLAWLFMTFQGTRRLYESLTLTKPSQSKMWVGLWLIGMAYYIFIGLSVWIEGAGT